MSAVDRVIHALRGCIRLYDVSCMHITFYSWIYRCFIIVLDHVLSSL